MKSSYELFPTPVWHIEGISQQLVEELYQGAYHFKERHKNSILSNQGGYQTPPFDWNKFHPQGKEYIDKVVGDIFNEIKVIKWWYNINGKGSWNLPHSHSGSDLALVLYLTDTDNLLTFINPFSQRRLNEVAGFHPKTKKGDILIFPADLLHYVMPNPREEDRISISMNLQLCGNSYIIGEG